MAYKRTESGVLKQMGVSTEEGSTNTKSGAGFPKNIKRCLPVPIELNNSEENIYLSNVGKQFSRNWRDAYGIPQFEYNYFHQRKVDTNGRKLKPRPWALHLPKELQSKSFKKILKKTKYEVDILDVTDSSILKTDEIKKEPYEIKDEADIKKELDEDVEAKDENNETQLSDRSDEEQSDQEMDEYTDYAQNYFDNGDDDGDHDDDDEEM